MAEDETIRFNRLGFLRTIADSFTDIADFTIAYKLVKKYILNLYIKSSQNHRHNMSKWIYHFGAGAAEGNMALKNILGGKGACLAEMSSLGSSCSCWFYNHNRCLQSLFSSRFHIGLKACKRIWNKPLSHLKKKVERVLVPQPIHCWYLFVRSTCFHAWNDGYHFQFGLNDDTTEALAELTGNEKIRI